MNFFSTGIVKTTKQPTLFLNCFKEIIKVFSYILLLAQLKTAGRAQGSAPYSWRVLSHPQACSWERGVCTRGPSEALGDCETQEVPWIHGWLPRVPGVVCSEACGGKRALGFWASLRPYSFLQR